MSSVPVVKAALVALLTTALPATQVIYGSRGAATTTGPRILLVGAVQGRQTFTSLDSSSRLETYTVECEASASIAGVSQQLADEMALSDFAAAVSAVNSHDFGGGVSADATGAFSLVEVATEKGRNAAVRFFVDVHAVF